MTRWRTIALSLVLAGVFAAPAHAVTVPTLAEFNALKERVAALEGEVSTLKERVARLEVPIPVEEEPAAGPLFRETFDTSPAPTDYGDTTVWSNDGERMAVSGGVGWVTANKIRLWTHAIFPAESAVEATVTPTLWNIGVPATWGGFKFYLRRELDQTASGFYTVEPMIYDGSIRIQKKDRAGETYAVLAEKKGYPVPLGGVHTWKATATGINPVTISLYRDGTLLLSATDNGSQLGAPLPPGHVGFRSDYLQYQIDNFTVTGL